VSNNIGDRTNNRQLFNNHNQLKVLTIAIEVLKKEVNSSLASSHDRLIVSNCFALLAPTQAWLANQDSQPCPWVAATP